MLVALPHLSVSHGYLSCTNIDDGLHTHRSTTTLFKHLSDKRCLYLVPYNEYIQRFRPNCGPPCEKLHRKLVRHYNTAHIFEMWLLDFAYLIGRNVSLRQTRIHYFTVNHIKDITLQCLRIIICRVSFNVNQIGKCLKKVVNIDEICRPILRR
jgi:hypothetical protein